LISIMVLLNWSSDGRSVEVLARLVKAPALRDSFFENRVF